MPTIENVVYFSKSSSRTRVDPTVVQRALAKLLSMGYLSLRPFVEGSIYYMTT